MESSGTLQGLVATAASVHSQRVAVTFDDGSSSSSPVSLLYKDLGELSSELCRLLQQHCADNNGVIGLYCSDDLFIPVWILGILQTPAAYMPLDPGAPGLVFARVMINCRLRFCAVKSDLLQRFQAALTQHMSVEVCALLHKFKLTLVRVEPLTDGKQDVAKIEKLPSLPERVEGLAYVLHTSGTTGLPKIVRVPHNCILPNILHLRHLFSVSCGDVVFLASPLTFDPSVVDLFLALSSGAQLLIVPAMLKKIPKRLCQLLFRRHKTTLMQVTPTLLSRFGPRLLRQEVLSRGSSLRVLALGGEACPPLSMLNAWHHQDNATAVFNVYGVTEVSCWATCYQILPSDLRQPDGSASFAVPLGSPLMGTRVEVRDQDGGVVTEGEGEVYIGGDERVCLLDHEDSAVPGTMRATGDWVEVRGGQMYYLGRKDRSIKRHGKRVNLDHLQQMLSNLPEVESCAVCLHDDSRLLAFVVLAASAGSEEAGSPFPSELSRNLQKQLTPLLPSYAIPDTVVHVPSLPLTPHAKVDMRALVKIYQKQRTDVSRPRKDVAELKETLQTLWQDALGLDGNAKLDDGSRFLFGGGDSLKALRLCEDILAATGVGSTRILEAVLNGTFGDVLRLVVAPGKRECIAAEATSEEGERSCPLKVFKGESEMTETRTEDRSVLALNERWSSDTGRCVDASPALLVREGQDSIRTVVFIGSHSHRMQALDLDSGHLLWERVLGGRVEASAGVSPCGRYMVVGCYDGNVYVLSADSGETRWVFETGDAVKSRPAADHLTGRMMVGSHDGFVYALDLQAQRCIWSRHCGGGAIFSSPYLDAARRQLYVATLGGKLLCLHPVRFQSTSFLELHRSNDVTICVVLWHQDSGEVLWSHSRDVPFFSSPKCGGDGSRVAIGSVDKNIICFSHDGTMVWQFRTDGAVFSSPCITSDLARLLCGSHDGRLYCLNAADGSLLWTFQTAGKVFASPCAFDSGMRGELVGVASTDGTVYVLDARNGLVLCSRTLPGELFSSPVVCRRSLVVGCRNDFVYCLQIDI
ncbi:beta-alanine-activating enzyme isoform X1 [Hippocampus zosterae]|uniref:beta-alanine-activating enzyme isoform X1 n=1 Tax=Hippocampus zosterae TaxID=109293 RepID=UPI00223E0032|nr:beta-alanine-activating enzyme isoform X1 [Hippocampus zosterae]